MKVIIPGYRYELYNFDNPNRGAQTLQFIHKEHINLETVRLEPVEDGTTNEEVLEVLIDRLTFLNQRLPSRQTSLAITKCQEALFWLNDRTAERQARRVEGRHEP